MRVMAGPWNGDGSTHKSTNPSRRSKSSSPARSSPVPDLSRSPSPRTKRLRRTQEERELERSGYRDVGRSRDRDRDFRDRDRNRGREREREKDLDRKRTRDRTQSRDSFSNRDHERPRGRGKSKELERPHDRGNRDRPQYVSSVRFPVCSHHDISFIPKDNLRQWHQHSPSGWPQIQRSSKHDQHTKIGTSAAGCDEDGDDLERERNRGEHSPQGDASIAKMKEIEASLEEMESNKEKRSFQYSGKLAAETNKVKGVALQFTEPSEARKPTTRWRLYVFKDGEPLNDPLYIHRQTCYLFGRERRVADIPTDHPSCSKQHAVIQFRLIDKDEGNGLLSSKVRPYVMDLGSTNGTTLNGERLDPQRYYEMFEKDTIKFGNSSREYVLLHEHSIG